MVRGTYVATTALGEELSERVTGVIAIQKILFQTLLRVPNQLPVEAAGDARSNPQVSGKNGVQIAWTESQVPPEVTTAKLKIERKMGGG